MKGAGVLQQRKHLTQKVMIVDDNVDAACALAEVLRLCGCEVTVAPDVTS